MIEVRHGKTQHSARLNRQAAHQIASS